MPPRIPQKTKSSLDQEEQQRTKRLQDAEEEEEPENEDNDRDDPFAGLPPIDPKNFTFDLDDKEKSQQVLRFQVVSFSAECLLFVRNYFRFLYRSALSFLIGILTNWTQLLTHPVNALLMVAVIPFLYVLLGILGFWSGILHLIGFDTFFDRVSKAFASGKSLANWSNAPLFEQLGNKELVEHLLNASSAKHFDSKVARALALFSALVYEDFDIIEKKARVWGLGVIRRPHLNREKVAPAILFAAPSKNTVIVVLRGTSPINFNEWIVDFSLLKCDARPYVSGQVHAGFFETLFYRNPNTLSPPGATNHPYQAIITELKEMLHKFKSEEEPHPIIKVWITGHSLGGALATLFYARVVQTRADIAPGTAIGAYTFGSPRVGDYDFAADLTSCLSTPIDVDTKLWRVVNANDVAPHYPIGFDGLTRIRSPTPVLLDFAHVGSLVQLHYRQSTKIFPHIQPGLNRFLSRLYDLPSLIQDNLFHWEWKAALAAFRSGNLIHILTWFLPSPIKDHSPAFYFQNLSHDYEISTICPKPDTAGDRLEEEKD